jgi:hypothetical protein
MPPTSRVELRTTPHLISNVRSFIFGASAGARYLASLVCNAALRGLRGQAGSGSTNLRRNMAARGCAGASEARLAVEACLGGRLDCSAAWPFGWFRDQVRGCKRNESHPSKRDSSPLLASYCPIIANQPVKRFSAPLFP